MTPRHALRSATALCTVVGVLLGGTSCSTPAPKCSDFSAQDGTAPDDVRATVFVVDVTDNSADVAARIARELEPEITPAVREGGRLLARLSGGLGEPVERPACFDDLSSVYLVERDNDERERNDRIAAVDFLQDEIARQVRATSVAERGSAVPLLVEARNTVDELVGQGVPPDRIKVVLRSNLLGVSDDCLNLDGLAASPDIAAQIVESCFESGQLGPLPPGVGLAIRGVGDGFEEPGQPILARSLAELLCQRLSDSCET